MMKKIHEGTKKIQITFGGGMGGASITWYATKIVRKENEWLVDAVGKTTGTISLNPKYVVYVQPGYDVYEREGSLYAVNSLDDFDADSFIPGVNQINCKARHISSPN